MLLDLRLAARRVLYARGFSLCVIIILGVGIGATTAMFSVLHALAFKTLDVPNAQALVAVMSVDRESLRRSTPLPAIDHLRRAALSADGWCGLSSVIEATEADGRLVEAYGELMAGDCVNAIGLAPAVGRWFEPAEAPLTGAGQPVIVITHRYWQRMFDGAPDVVGRTVRIGTAQAQVVGIMPPHFTGLSPEYATDFIIPFNAHRPASGAQWFLGRMHDGASIDRLKAQVRALWPSVLQEVLPQGPTRAQLLNERSGDAESFSGGFSILRRLYATPVRNMTILAVGLILLVCVNVGGLLLARVSARAQEIAAMRALGAGTVRLARPLFFEGVVYALAGTMVGVPLAFAGSSAFGQLLPWANIPWTISLTPDATILSGMVAAVFALALLIASLPALIATRRTTLAHQNRIMSRATGRLARTLLVAQIALTVTMVFTGGLVIRSFNALWNVDRGFNSDGVLSIRLVPNPGGYDKFDQAPYYTGLLERLRTLAGVESVGFARYFGTINSSLGSQPIALAGAQPSTSGAMEYISPQFFETVGIPLLSGRDVSWTDLPSTPKVALVSESLARALSPDGDVVGRVIRYGTTDPTTAQLQIIGIVGNISLGNFRDTTARMVYMSGIQAGQATYATVQLRTSGDPLSLARPATEMINASTREHVQRAVPVDFLFTNGVVAERMATVASTVTGVLALIISCIGLFALLSHSVARRTREIGIRIAVGASATAVSALVLRDACVLVVCGFVAGIPGALAAASLVKALLFGVSTTDATTMIASAAMMLVTALAAAVPPALRAVRVDPAIALRAE